MRHFRKRNKKLQLKERNIVIVKKFPESRTTGTNATELTSASAGNTYYYNIQFFNPNFIYYNYNIQ